mgnify:FL=1|jgi:hypothetical protein|tara:strand:- start:1671 stop:2030 length:360 start_codon:yes stop_codon:yes gene_type:complete
MEARILDVREAQLKSIISDQSRPIDALYGRLFEATTYREVITKESLLEGHRERGVVLDLLDERDGDIAAIVVNKTSLDRIKLENARIRRKISSEEIIRRDRLKREAAKKLSLEKGLVDI